MEINDFEVTDDTELDNFRRKHNLNTYKKTALYFLKILGETKNAE